VQWEYFCNWLGVAGNRKRALGEERILKVDHQNILKHLLRLNEWA